MIRCVGTLILICNYIRRVRSRISIELTALVGVGKGCSIYKIASGMDVGLGGHVVLSRNNIKHIWLFLAVLRLSAVTTLSVVVISPTPCPFFNRLLGWFEVRVFHWSGVSVS